VKPEQKISLWINHNNLLWSRFQTASVIEGGALAAAYQIYNLHKYWASALLILAELLLFLVLLLMCRDVLHIKSFEPLDKEADLPSSTEKPIWQPIDDTFDILREGKWKEIRGRHIGLIMIGALIAFNVIAALCFLGLHCPCLNSN
jgi:hypothetical protein